MKLPGVQALFSLLSISFLGLSVASGQTSSVKLKFVAFPKIADPEPVELFLGEDRSVEVELPTNSISEAYEVPAMASWSLGKTRPDEEGELTFEAYGTARSVGGSDQLVLVIREGKADADGLKLIPFRNDGNGFSGGKYLLLNATKVDIAGKIGTAEFALKPNGHGLIAPGPTETRGDRKYCFAKIYFRKQEKVQPFFSSTWRFNENARSMVFFYHDPNTGRLRLHTIRSFVR